MPWSRVFDRATGFSRSSTTTVARSQIFGSTNNDPPTQGSAMKARIPKREISRKALFPLLALLELTSMGRRAQLPLLTFPVHVPLLRSGSMRPEISGCLVGTVFPRPRHQTSSMICGCSLPRQVNGLGSADRAAALPPGSMAHWGLRRPATFQAHATALQRGSMEPAIFGSLEGKVPPILWPAAS